MNGSNCCFSVVMGGHSWHLSVFTKNKKNEKQNQLKSAFPLKLLDLLVLTLYKLT